MASTSKKQDPSVDRATTTAPDFGTVEAYHHDAHHGNGSEFDTGDDMDGRGKRPMEYEEAGGGYSPGEAYGVETVMPRVSRSRIASKPGAHGWF